MLTIVKKAITDTIDSAQEEPVEEKEKNETHPTESKQKKNWIGMEVVILLMKIIAAFFESLVKLLLPPHEKPLYNEIVLITGSGGGIGRAVAIEFAAQGATVVCLDRNEEGNKETETIIKATGLTRVHAYTCDVSDRIKVQEACKRIEEEVGRISILVNNAGILNSKRFSSHTTQDVINTFSVNVFAHFWTLESILPNMRKYNHGHVVALCSLCGVNAIPNLSAYCSSKFAVRGLMDSLYEEIRAENPDSQIKFTSIYPYMVDTGLVKKPKTRFPDLLKLLTPEEVAEQVIKAVKQDIRELSIPSSFLHTSRIFRFFPQKVVELIKDFMDTGVDPEE